MKVFLTNTKERREGTMFNKRDSLTSAVFPVNHNDETLLRLIHDKCNSDSRSFFGFEFILLCYWYTPKGVIIVSKYLNASQSNLTGVNSEKVRCFSGHYNFNIILAHTIMLWYAGHIYVNNSHLLHLLWFKRLIIRWFMWDSNVNFLLLEGC